MSKDELKAKIDHIRGDVALHQSQSDHHAKKVDELIRKVSDLEAQLAEMDRVPSIEDVYANIKPTWSVSHGGKPKCCIYGGLQMDGEHVPSENHALQLAAIARVMVVAEYVNEGWKPDWENVTKEKWGISLDDGKYVVNMYYGLNRGVAFFPSKNAATRAIEILNADNPATLRHYFGLFD